MPKALSDKEREDLLRQVDILGQSLTEYANRAEKLARITKSRYGVTPGEMIDRLREASTPPPGVSPDFAQAHPTITAILNTLSAPIRGLMETAPGRFLQRSSEAGAEALMFAPGALQEMYGGYTETSVPALDQLAQLAGSVAGTIPLYLGAGQIAGAAGQALGRIPQLARLGQLAPQALRVAGRGVATGAALAGIRTAATEKMPTAQEIGRDIAFMGGAGLGGSLAGQALESAFPAIHPLVEAPIVGAAAGAAGGAAAYPFSGKRGKEYLKEMGPQVLAMAVLNMAMVAGSPSTWQPRVEFGKAVVRFRQAHQRWINAVEANDQPLANAAYRDLMQAKNDMYRYASLAKVPKDILGSKTDWTKRMEDALARDLQRRGWTPIEEMPKAQPKAKPQPSAQPEQATIAPSAQPQQPIAVPPQAQTTPAPQQAPAVQPPISPKPTPPEIPQAPKPRKAPVVTITDLTAMADAAADKYGIPREIFRNLISAESSWDLKAVSPKGAIGLTQIMPDTAKELGASIAKLKNNPELQIELGARYLAEQYKRFGSWDKALAAYNAGPGNVEKGIIPAETQEYVRKVLGQQIPIPAQVEISTPSAKPYEGLRPGTKEWMQVWKQQPELQQEMLEYARRLREQPVPAPETRQEAVQVPVEVPKVETPSVQVGPTSEVIKIKRYRTASSIPDTEIVRIATKMGPSFNSFTDLVAAVRQELGVSDNVAAKAINRVLDKGLLEQKEIIKIVPSPAGSFNVPQVQGKWEATQPEKIETPSVQVPKAPEVKIKAPIEAPKMETPPQEVPSSTPEVQPVSPKEGETYLVRIARTGQEYTGRVNRIFRVKSGAVLAQLETEDGKKLNIPVSKYALWYPVEEAKPSAPETQPPEGEDILKNTVDKLNNDLAFKRTAEEKYGAPGAVSQLGGQIQFIRDVIEEVRKKKSTQLSDADVERVLSVTKAPRTAIDQAKESLRKIGEGIKDIFVYEWRVQDYPKFVDELRRFQGVTRDAQVSALNTYKAIVGHLDTPQEFEIFRKLIFLRDFKASLEAGEPVPGDLTPEQVDKAIQELEAKANDNVKRALEAHDAVFNAAWEELKRRGKVDPETEGREHYVPHRVLDYIRDQDYQFPAVGRRFKAPYRYYLQERKGSTKLIDTDYTGITLNHLTKLYIDNATDDFAQQIAAEYDAYPKLSKEQKEKIGKPVPNKLYEINGKRYLGWQYEPGRQIYPASSVYEEAVLDLIEQVAQEEVTPEKAQELLAKKIKTVPAIGRYKRTYLLPEEIAYRLIRLKEPALKYHTLEAVRDLVLWWKSQVLGPLAAGIPFQVQNFIGDVINLYREDPAALLLLGEGWRAAGEWQKNLVSPERKKLIDVAEKSRVVEAGLMRKSGLPYDPLLAKLEPGRYLLRGANPAEWYRNISERRELSVRLAKLAADLRRIEQGKMPVAQYEDVKKLESAGLTKEEIAGKIAREFTVDYGKLTPEQKGIIRDILFTFSTFYQENFRNWSSYVKRNPKDFLVKFLVPLGALALYNWTRFPEEERKLPLYYRVMPHLITGYKTPDGKPIIIALQTPIDMAAKMIGLEIVPDLARQVLIGEKSMGEATKELATHVMGAIPRAMWDLFNPFFKAPIEAAMNKNTFTDSPIVPERLKGTPEGKKMLVRYIVQQWFAPYGQYMRATRQLDPEAGIVKWLAQGPADLKRAVGIREVDVDREMINRFYNRLEELEAQYRQWKDQREKGKIVPMPTFMPELRRLRSLKSRVMDKQWQIIRRIENSNYPPEEKRRIISNIRRGMANLAERMVK